MALSSDSRAFLLEFHRIERQRLRELRSELINIAKAGAAASVALSELPQAFLFEKAPPLPRYGRELSTEYTCGQAALFQGHERLALQDERVKAVFAEERAAQAAAEFDNENWQAKLDALQKKKAQRLAQADTIGAFMFELSERKDIITEFDERLWLTTLAKATAYHDGRLVFTFQNGIEIEG